MSYPELTVGRVMGTEELFRYGLFLNGIRDPETVAQLWHEERAKRKGQR